MISASDRAKVRKLHELERDRGRRNAERRAVVARLPLVAEIARVRSGVTFIDAHDRIACIVGCGKSKGEAPSSVRDMYRSPLFRKSLELAELVGDRTFVASARHGLLELDDVITPYETKLSRASKHERETWAHSVVGALETRTLGGSSRLLVVLLMGATYADPIVAEIDRRRARGAPRFAKPTELLRGLEIGERLAFLNRAIVLARGAQ